MDQKCENVLWKHCFCVLKQLLFLHVCLPPSLSLKFVLLIVEWYTLALLWFQWNDRSILFESGRKWLLILLKILSTLVGGHFRGYVCGHGLTRRWDGYHTQEHYEEQKLKWSVSQPARLLFHFPRSLPPPPSYYDTIQTYTLDNIKHYSIIEIQALLTFFLHP